MVFYAIIALALLACVFNCVNFLRNTERGVVLRLGRMIGNWSEPLGPGIRWVWWPLETMVRWSVFADRQDLLGAEGEALGDLGPGREGLVRIKGELFRATSSRSIPCGQNVRIVGNDGPNVRVELGSEAKSKEELLDQEITKNLEFLRVSPTALGHYLLAKLYEKKGDLQAAAQQYTIAEKLNPSVRDDYEKRAVKQKS